MPAAPWAIGSITTAAICPASSAVKASSSATLPTYRAGKFQFDTPFRNMAAAQGWRHRPCPHDRHP